MSAMMDGISLMRRDEDDCIYLPPGFRFHPTDEEIITSYLTEKVIAPIGFTSRVMGEVDLNKCEPWDLPSKAKMGEKEWYFFCQKDRKYPTGMRTNRATQAGYWKATGKDKEIYRGKDILVGMKKTLVFYKGRAPKGEKTNWVMHEFRLESNDGSYNNRIDAKDEWVVCKVFHKSIGIKRSPSCTNSADHSMDLIMDPYNSLYGSQEKHRSSMFTSDEVSCGNMFGHATNLCEPSSSSINIENHRNVWTTSMLQNSYHQTSHQYPYNFILPGLANLDYLHQEQAMAKALSDNCDEGKVVEQPNDIVISVMNCNNGIVNEDQGLKNSMTTTNSYSKREMRNHQHSDYELDGMSSAGPFVGFDSLWKY